MRGRIATLAAALFVTAPACGGGGSTAPAAAVPVPAEPRWEDVFDTTPELLAVLHPMALRSDPVYGPLLRRAIELARQQSTAVAQSRALDSVEDAEEVILGVRTGGSDGQPGRATADEASEVVVVLRGVRADIDPATLVDGDGKPLWQPGPQGAVRELVRGDGAGHGAQPPVSLFELPGRTWVIASGEARLRARGVFARPLGRPALHFEGGSGKDGPSGSLALLRMDGPSLVSHVRALQPTGTFGALGRRLLAVTVELAAGAAVAGPPGADAGAADRDLQGTLTYADEDSAGVSEITVRQVLDLIGRKNPSDLGWLGSAAVARPGKRVVVTAPLPPGFVEALSRIGKAPPASPTSP